jgi:uncharacterized protein YciI
LRDVRDRAHLQSRPQPDRRADEGARRFLKKYYDAGNFLISGRQIPRTGGIIIAVGESRDGSRP